MFTFLDYDPGFTLSVLQPLALKTLPLFISQAEADVPEALRLSLLQIIFDLLMVHDRTFLASGEENVRLSVLCRFH